MSLTNKNTSQGHDMQERQACFDGIWQRKQFTQTVNLRLDEFASLSGSSTRWAMHRTRIQRVQAVLRETQCDDFSTLLFKIIGNVSLRFIDQLHPRYIVLTSLGTCFPREVIKNRRWKIWFKHCLLTTKTVLELYLIVNARCSIYLYPQPHKFAEVDGKSTHSSYILCRLQIWKGS